MPESSMKLTSILTVLTSLLLVSFHSPAWAKDPNAIVVEADKVRAPSGSYYFNAQVLNFEGSEKKADNGYKVYVKDLDRSVLEFLSPASEKGKSMLMLQDDVWVFLPRLRKPVRVPLKQRLLGEVAIGDMTRTNFSHDYTASLLGEESVNGKSAYKLELQAKSPKKPYHQIHYWVEKETFRPIQAEYFAVSGKSLKTAMWKEFSNQGGVTRPRTIEYQDSINKSKKSILIFENFTKKNLEDRMFTKQYLRTFN